MYGFTFLRVSVGMPWFNSGIFISMIIEINCISLENKIIIPLEIIRVAQELVFEKEK